MVSVTVAIEVCGGNFYARCHKDSFSSIPEFCLCNDNPGGARSFTIDVVAHPGLGYLNLSLEGVKVNSVDYLLVACVYASVERC